MLDQMDDQAIAEDLNARQRTTRMGDPFLARHIFYIRRSYKLKTRQERLQARGLLTAREVAVLLDTDPLYVDYWREQGVLHGVRLNRKNEHMYERPDEATVATIAKRRRKYQS
jgi:hypothetical protein